VVGMEPQLVVKELPSLGSCVLRRRLSLLESVGNTSSSLSLTLDKGEKVEHYIRIKNHKSLP